MEIEAWFEPLGSVSLARIHWVIVGGESGPGARPMEEAWVHEVKMQCEIANVPFSFKQWGGVNKKKAGRLLDGKTWEAVPVTA
jgi:protein gp37